MEKMATDLSSDFVESLRDYMAREAISGAELARRLGVSRQYVYHLLDTDTSITFETAERLLAKIGGKPRLSVAFKSTREKIPV